MLRNPHGMPGVLAKATLSGVAAVALAAAAFVAGCGGADDPGSANPPQCSGSNCPPTGPSTNPGTPVSLCPASLDYTTTYTGGSGSGEYIKVKFDTAKKTYQMQFIASSVPTSAGQINNTRAGLTINGAIKHPTNLPTAEQNRCAFVLQDGKTDDGKYAVTINPQDPPMLFVGKGIVGGGIPGATIEFAGLLGGAIGKVPSRSFDFFPFLGFSETVTDFAQVAGTYNELGVHMIPTGTGFQSAERGWQPDAVNWSQSFDAQGNCKPDTSDYSCRTTGSPWTLRQNADGTPDNVFISQPAAGKAYPVAGQGQPIVLLAPSKAHGIMIVGKLNGQLVPVIVRVGFSHEEGANLFAAVADDEIGISILSPATAVPANALKGGYIGGTSGSACGVVGFNGNKGAPASNANGFDNTVPHPDLPGVYANGFFNPSAGNCIDATAVSSLAANYTSTLFQNTTAALINPTTSGVRAQFTLDYAQAKPGKITVTAQSDFTAKGANGDVALFSKDDTGVLVKVGDVYAMLINNSKVNPFFTVGAFVQ